MYWQGFRFYGHILAQQRLHFRSCWKVSLWQLPLCLSAGFCPVSCCVAAHSVTSPVDYNILPPKCLWLSHDRLPSQSACQSIPCLFLSQFRMAADETLTWFIWYNCFMSSIVTPEFVLCLSSNFLYGKVCVMVMIESHQHEPIHKHVTFIKLKQEIYHM